MKIQMLKKLLLVVTATFILVGCGSAKVVNVNKTFNTKATSDYVKEKIIKSGKNLGWTMKAVKKGEIKGFITLRGHTAIIKILYNHDSYKINYVSSENLNFNKDNNTINNNYNGWINNLKITIDNYLTDLTFTNELKEQAQASAKDKANNNNPDSDINIKDIKQTINNLDIKSIESGIEESLDSLGWHYKKQKEGLYLAKIAIRTHTATIKIEYSKTEYSITYLTSTNLRYKNYSIHRNYNGWIKNLSSSINSQLNVF